MLSAHTLDGMGDGLDFTIRTDSRWIKLANNLGDSERRDVSGNYQIPNSVNILGRWVMADEFEPIRCVQDGADPVAIANGVYDSIVREKVLSHPRISYWEVCNEPVTGSWKNDGLNTIKYMQALNRYCLQMATRLVADGKKPVIGNFSVGTPDLPEHDRLIIWKEFYPALKYTMDVGGRLGLHEYTNGVATWETWLQLRYKWVLRYLDSAGLSALRILVTESGTDYLPDGGPWREMFSDVDAYARVMSDYISKCQADYPRVEAVFLFTFGGASGWPKHNVDGVGFTDAWLRVRPVFRPSPIPVIVPVVAPVTPVPSDGATHVVNADVLNIRMFPWTGNVVPPVVSRFSRGQRVTQYGPDFVVGNSRWVCVSPNGNLWVSGAYLKRV